MIVQVLSMLKMILNGYDQLDQVQSMSNIRQDNDVIVHTGAIYAENDTKLS